MNVQDLLVYVIFGVCVISAIRWILKRINKKDNNGCGCGCSGCSCCKEEYDKKCSCNSPHDKKK